MFRVIACPRRVFCPLTFLDTRFLHCPARARPCPLVPYHLQRPWAVWTMERRKTIAGFREEPWPNFKGFREGPPGRPQGRSDFATLLRSRNTPDSSDGSSRDRTIHGGEDGMLSPAFPIRVVPRGMTPQRKGAIVFRKGRNKTLGLTPKGKRVPHVDPPGLARTLTATTPRATSDTARLHAVAGAAFSTHPAFATATLNRAGWP